jgi:hypothetical protein
MNEAPERQFAVSSSQAHSAGCSVSGNGTAFCSDEANAAGVNVQLAKRTRENSTTRRCLQVLFKVFHLHDEIKVY